MAMRLKSGIWVAAYVRRCHVEGAFAAVRKRGADEAGAVFITINNLDGSGVLYGPAPQSAFDTEMPLDRLFTLVLGRQGPVPEADIDARLKRESGFDPVLWCVEVEDKAGRHFRDNVVA